MSTTKCFEFCPKLEVRDGWNVCCGQRPAEIERVLRENGLTDEPGTYDSSIHSWRCAHPDRYGPCTCFAELVADLAALGSPPETGGVS